jgi:protein-disulfide isomerase
LFAFAAAIVVAAAAASVAAGQQPQTSPPPARGPHAPSDATAVFLAEWAKEPHVTTGVTAAAGKIVILKFSDWECPGCRATHAVYKPTLDKFAASIKYVEKDYPLNTDCNAHAARTIPGHEASCLAAAAVRLARATGRAGALGDWIFAHQDTTPAVLRQAAATVGGVTNLDAEYPSVLPAIRRDTEAGAALKIGGTPAYFVNGVLVKGFLDGKLNDRALLVPEFFDAAVQYEIKKAAVR